MSSGANSRSAQNRSRDDGDSRPGWAETVELRTVDAGGLLRPVTVHLGAPSVARIALLDGDSLTEFGGADYRDCLTRARRLLEREGRLLCCQGARPNVHPSGQLLQFCNGREAYALHPEGRIGPPETVDVFAPAPPGDVVSLDDQRAAIIGAWNARHPANPIRTHPVPGSRNPDPGAPS
ncbi:hypothetical protein [Kitasatospora sp. NPDC002965]|uniref:hypothetical protein n=1 Tax=Kitasatospora sp. NPDC002965 TaxID=3154775 RepID=UPI0033A19AB0